MFLFCPMCGRQFDGEGGKRFCSDECKSNMQKQKRKEYHQKKNAVIIKSSHNCANCGMEFVPEGRSDTLYCTPKCQAEAKAKRKNIELTERICVVCGEKFMPVQNKQVCCKKECVQKKYYQENKEKKKQQAKKWRQENSERVRENDRRKREQNKELYQQINQEYHDKTRFGGNRHFALEADDYKCALCGSTENLAVHHRDKSGNSDNPNNEVTNLITLCSSCHTKVHRPRLDTTPHTKHTCPICGNEFRVSQARVDENRGKYCSKECANKAKETSVEIVCQHCGKEFQVTPSRLKRGKVKYCSMECRKQAGYAWTNKEK